MYSGIYNDIEQRTYLDQSSKKRGYDELVKITNKILPGLYLGSVYSEHHYSKFDIVINCDWPDNKVQQNHINISIKDGVTVYNLGVDDREFQNIGIFLDLFTSLIHTTIKGGGTVLVHCHAGVSRSVTIVLSYLIGYHNMSLENALKYVKAKRPIVSPNRGFMKQLEKRSGRI